MGFKVTDMAASILGVFLLATVVLPTSSMNLPTSSAPNHGCEAKDCVPLQQCSNLVQLLRTPSSDSIRKLQAATCFIERSIPMVCCQVKRAIKPPSNKLIPSKAGSCGQGTTNGLSRIFGGQEAPINGYPWIVAMGYSEIGFGNIQYHCAGSIINERYILTAAHCVSPSVLNLKKLEIITIGEWDLATSRDCQRTSTGLELCAPPSKNFTYEEIVIHPKYNTRAPYSDDIALIRLSSPIDFSTKWVHPICLPPHGMNLQRLVGDREAVVAGWGTTESGQGSSRLLHVLLPPETVDFCNHTYGGKMVKGQVCFGGHLGQDSCAGDSGGPLILGGPGDQPPFLQIGIVSYGPSTCGLDSVPGVYTSVSDYREWIDENVRQ
ncbi:CLIP domain-containing serine protease B4-like [Palaemon carinicauda]|uniref:CLIP domain-containing serine protease B4-like n=1 Tax=Palaemon carinicauda TaxID=392227 RepID=UPI0035B6738B